jgi:hypothetical protein
LLDGVWADRVTTPDVLTQAIKELRRAFNDDAKPSRYIETIRSRLSPARTGQSARRRGNRLADPAA